MDGSRTDEELQGAAEPLFRLRAVESPEDRQTRLRTVWHHGARDAELVSQLAPEGAFVRHELRLFEEVCIWEREGGFSTGRHAEGAVRRDAAPRAEVLDRVLAVVDRYDGADGVLLHLQERLRERRPKVDAPTDRRTNIIFVVGLVIVALSLLWFAVQLARRLLSQ